VLQNFLEIWSEAEVHVLLYNKQKTQGEFERYKKKVSYLNVIPGIKQHPRLFLPLMPGAIESFQFDDYDLVLSDSSSFAKGVKTDKLHICYCHAPTRFLWTELGYLDQQKYPGIFKGLGKLLLPRLKKWDLAAAQRPTFFIANSVNVQNRIRKYYQRESEVIFAPVDTEFFSAEGGSTSGGHTQKQDYFFAASRLEPYKKIETVIEAFNELDKPLKIAGTGTDLERLKAMAGSNIEFLGRVTDEELRKHYSEAQAFIFPAEEDAGIMPLEAMACGTPVIAFGFGGALETIQQGITGEFFYEQSAESLKNVVNNFDSSKYNSQTIRTHALQFDKKIFQKRIKEFVEEKYRIFKRE
jgi:glycosyltransferase involved in cell wall biosynthesis